MTYTQDMQRILTLLKRQVNPPKWAINLSKQFSKKNEIKAIKNMKSAQYHLFSNKTILK